MNTMRCTLHTEYLHIVDVFLDQNRWLQMHYMYKVHTNMHVHILIRNLTPIKVTFFYNVTYRYLFLFFMKTIRLVKVDFFTKPFRIFLYTASSITVAFASFPRARVNVASLTLVLYANERIFCPNSFFFQYKYSNSFAIVSQNQIQCL